MVLPVSLFEAIMQDRGPGPRQQCVQQHSPVCGVEALPPPPPLGVAVLPAQPWDIRRYEYAACSNEPLVPLHRVLTLPGKYSKDLIVCNLLQQALCLGTAGAGSAMKVQPGFEHTLPAPLGPLYVCEGCRFCKQSTAGLLAYAVCSAEPFAELRTELTQ